MPNFISRAVTSKFYDSLAHNQIGFESIATRSAGGGPPIGYAFLRGQNPAATYTVLRGQTSAGVYVNLAGKTA